MGKYIASILALFMAANAFGMVDQTSVRQRLNTSANAGPSVNLGWQVVDNKVQLLKCKYDFATQGGAIGAINLKAVDGSKCELPTKAIVMDILIDVITAPTSGGSATIAVGTGQAANDIKTATAIASFTNLLDGIPVSTAATSIKLTAKRNPTMTIATAALTAGKFNVFIEYVLSE